MSDVNKVRTLVLDGYPRCTLHLPDAERTRWIAGAVEAKSEEVRKIVDEICAGREVTALETHGPGLALPAEYHARSHGNVSGLTGVTLRFSEGEPLRHTETYSTLGGSPPLVQCDPSSASTILMQALRKAGTLLQSK